LAAARARAESGLEIAGILAEHELPLVHRLIGATLITADRRLLARIARGRTRVAVMDLATL
jgi:hypothetical protein